ncbi:MAG: hypothetical protein CVT89_02470 [Candidatus Altiarchaeales archaeon HGW-Altiarchaeales-2]|nr:MAG: hypothetical protein CVT89_02470 [Candidatus Altiarchaeales archaeon HGW-Altiarchaeales-2]
MQIKELKIENFKGISYLKFSPKKINLIVGRNNTGKTSVLEAIDLLFNPENIVQMYGEHLSDIIHTETEYSELVAKIGKSKKKLRISKSYKSEVIYQFKKDVTGAFIRSLNKFFALINLPENIIDTEEIRHKLENKMDEAITPEIIGIISKKSVCLLKDSEDKTVRYHLPFSEYSRISRILLPVSLEIFEQISKQGTKSLNEKVLSYDEVLSVINANMFEMFSLFEHPTKISGGKNVVLIKDLSGVKFELEEKDAEMKRKIRNIESIIKEHNLIENLERLDFDYVTFKDKNEKLSFVPFSFLGDGFKVMVGLLWHISSPNMENKIVLLDEPETHMHPGYILELIKFLIKFSDKLNIRFFITTHSWDFLDLLLDKDNFSQEDQKYLEKDLLLLRMDKLDDSTIPTISDYKDAKYAKDKLFLDLRGI